jgi:hypothetical protein
MNEIIAKYSKTLIDLIFSEEVRFSPSMGENLPRAAGINTSNKTSTTKFF